MNETIFIVGEGWGNECAKIGLGRRFSKVIPVTGCVGVELNDLRGETIVFAGYKPIVPNDVLSVNTCINVHYSLLPKYRGFHSTVWAILNDEDELGLSVHLMSKFIDDGPIIHQYRVENDRIKTSCEYMELFNEYIADNLGRIIEDYLCSRTQLICNNKNEATWVGKRNHDDCKIDFNRDLDYLQRFFRALVAPYPLPYILYKGDELIVTQVGFYKVNVETHVGRILNIDDDGLWVKVKDGYLIIKEMRDSSNNIVPYDKFKIGYFLK